MDISLLANPSTHQPVASSSDFDKASDELSYEGEITNTSTKSRKKRSGFRSTKSVSTKRKISPSTSNRKGANRKKAQKSVQESEEDGSDSGNELTQFNRIRQVIHFSTSYSLLNAEQRGEPIPEDVLIMETVVTAAQILAQSCDQLASALGKLNISKPYWHGMKYKNDHINIDSYGFLDSPLKITEQLDPEGYYRDSTWGQSYERYEDAITYPDREGIWNSNELRDQQSEYMQHDFNGGRTHWHDDTLSTRCYLKNHWVAINPALTGSLNALDAEHSLYSRVQEVHYVLEVLVKNGS